MAFWVHHAAARRPDRVAIEGVERSLTYRELSAAVTEAAGALERLGASGRVALALPPGEDFVVALHGCLLAGAAAVPVDLRHSAEERARRLAGASVIVDAPLRGSGPPVGVTACVGDE